MPIYSDYWTIFRIEARYKGTNGIGELWIYDTSLLTRSSVKSCSAFVVGRQFSGCSQLCISIVRPALSVVESSRNRSRSLQFQQETRPENGWNKTVRSTSTAISIQSNSTPGIFEFRTAKGKNLPKPFQSLLRYSWKIPWNSKNLFKRVFDQRKLL